MTSRSMMRACRAMLWISAFPACEGAHGIRTGDPQDRPASQQSSREVMRGMHVEPQGRLAIDQTLQVRASRTAAPRELHDGDQVANGDRIRATVVTSEDAYLYLAFCAGHELAMHPSQRGVRTRAGDPTVVPEGAGELVIDGDPGSEVLYIMVSRTELSLADPHLREALATGGRGANATDCGAGVDAASPQDEPDFIRGPGTIAGYGGGGIQGPGEVVAADAGGVAIVGYRFTHVAAARDDLDRSTAARTR